MNIVADINQPLAEEYFGSIGNVIRLSPEKITNQNLLKYQADILICRSTIKINKNLLHNTAVKYVGTCTIGYDHADLAYLHKHDIQFDSAPGCNAVSVSEYITAALLKLAIHYNLDLSKMTIGIIGVGNVGTQVMQKAKALGMNILLNDPPRARKEKDSKFRPLKEVLNKSDIITIHVPLINEGNDKTLKMVDQKFISKMKKGAFFFNASRGKVASDNIITYALNNKIIKEAVMDVFATEPEINKEFLQKLFIATEHISGHSIDGKINGTKIIYQKLCDYLNLPVSKKILNTRLEPKENRITIPKHYNGLRAIEYAVDSCYNIINDSEELKNNPQEFSRLRKNYPLRYEFSHYNIICHEKNIYNILCQLGFRKQKDEKIPNTPYYPDHNYI